MDGEVPMATDGVPLSQSRSATDSGSQYTERLIIFGRELQQLYTQLKQQNVLSVKSQRVLQDAFSLMAYSDPWTSPISYQLHASQREPVAAALNSAILGKNLHFIYFFILKRFFLFRTSRIPAEASLRNYQRARMSVTRGDGHPRFGCRRIRRSELLFRRFVFTLDGTVLMVSSFRHRSRVVASELIQVSKRTKIMGGKEWTIGKNSMYEHVDSVGDRSWSVVKLLIFHGLLLDFLNYAQKLVRRAFLIFA